MGHKYYIELIFLNLLYNLDLFAPLIIQDYLDNFNMIILSINWFIDHIIGDMKKNDIMQVESGVIKKDDVISCIINNNGSKIREILIKNYRQEERVDEIINTATWSLTRMIENSE